MYGRNIKMRIGGPITPMLKKLLIINGAVFAVQLIVGHFYPGYMETFFGLSHKGLAREFMLWQLFTYMFLHGGFLHILFNLFALWMFAGELEQLWGSRLFLKYYLYSGIGAGVFISIMNYVLFIKYAISVPTIGASGAIYAILLAYGMTWPNRKVLLYFVIPIKIKYLVLGFGLIEFISTINSTGGEGGGISHIGHIGGLIAGLVLMFTLIRRPASSIQKNQSSNKADNKIAGYIKKRKIQKKREVIDRRIKAKKIIDELLEKIAKKGMSSLTENEKKELEWARKNYYHDETRTLH